MFERGGKASLAVVLAAGLALRVGWGLTQGARVDERLPDQKEYLEIGKNLLAGNGLAFFDERYGQWVRAFRAPGYPLFLAGCGGSVRAARMAQAVLGTLTALAAYLLARRWLRHRAALAAAALVAVNPYLIYFSSLILSETLFTAIVAWGMVLLAWRMNYLWGGIVLACAVLVRPGAALLPLALGVAAVFATHERGEVERKTWMRLPVGATMLLLTVIALGGWAARNRLAVGKWVWLTTNVGVTKYDGFNPEATGASNQDFLKERELARLNFMNEVERDEHLSSLADRSIEAAWRTRPLWLLELTGKKIARTWSPMPLSADFGSRRLYVAVGLIFSIPVYVLVVVGLWSGGLPRAAKVFLLLPAIYLTAVHAMSVGSLRYRMPAEPALAVIAGAVVEMGRRQNTGTENQSKDEEAEAK